MSTRQAGPADAAALAELAAETFPLACPASTTPQAISEFIAEHLTESRFDSYLADPGRALFLAEVDGVAIGYTMLVDGEPTDADVASAISTRPTIEVSKFYVRAGNHGAGVAGELMAASLAYARERGLAAAWLGVNNENLRANRFYEKHGFARVGSKRFWLGDHWEDDFVRELVL
jgi:diamine N-acetyltransferase